MAEIAAALGVSTPEVVRIPTEFICEFAPEMIGTLKGDKAQFDKYAGQAVKIKGTIAGADLTVDSISPSR